MGAWEEARRYYANAHFAPTLHSEKVRRSHVDAHAAPIHQAEGRAGLERVHHQIARRKTTDAFNAFLKDTEAEYRIREAADLEKIRQQLITNRRSMRKRRIFV